ncbi:hypothetical protein DKM19_45255 [Streptosporangium sp. 'caverna']|nr:hypothetical protein DKM19_45255 [Streptosporangium sp. 'caverna']
MSDRIGDGRRSAEPTACESPLTSAGFRHETRTGACQRRLNLRRGEVEVLDCVTSRCNQVEGQSNPTQRIRAGGSIQKRWIFVQVVQEPSSFEVNSTRGDDTLIILASGELAYQRTEEMRTEIDKAWQNPQPALMIIDVSSVVFCDATGLCELTRALQLSRSASVRLILTGAQGNLRHLLTITGLDRIFQTSPSTTEALKSA